ncbi:hypothetical protein BD410DRAFT_896056 [Rickenella mellea]|uniref:Uncharacterized protein n=1 Tax=Rickenella mellea TaxID=50990 RepID=A0A4Y7QDU1_9AGAM|nr:hypothetical protein BD410DRAFT_896056 [Rickenella mellea]
MSLQPVVAKQQSVALRRDIFNRNQAVHFVESQQVEVRLRANVWVVGIIVSTLQALKKCMGLGYEVSYSCPHGMRTEEFRTEDIREAN